MADMIPWDEIEKNYADLFNDKIGNVAKPARMALGSLIIKERGGHSDEETVEQIKENPYLQFFIGLEEFTTKAPFDPSLMTHFRKRFSLEALKAINEKICQIERKDNDDEPPAQGPAETGEQSSKQEKPKNKGKLILDATCAPADIRYPSDLSLLNEAREKTEETIDTLYNPLRGSIKKPRTYRVKARKQYLLVAKTRRPNSKQIRKAIGQQLRYLRRNLTSIQKLEELHRVSPLNRRQQQNLATIKELYRQQKYMYEHRTHRIENRIVSISQPHIRPIVRGKIKAPTEFGAKISISLINGYALLDRLEWDNFNEGTTLIPSVEQYKMIHGCYPKSVHVDAIYRNRENIRYCTARGIRLSGPRLGRPPKEIPPAVKRLERQDARVRNAVEGKFGEGKRRYGLGRVMARLQETSETVIALQFLVMNLEHRLRLLFIFFSKSGFRYFTALFSRAAGRNCPAVV